MDVSVDDSKPVYRERCEVGFAGIAKSPARTMGLSIGPQIATLFIDGEEHILIEGCWMEDPRVATVLSLADLTVTDSLLTRICSIAGAYGLLADLVCAKSLSGVVTAQVGNCTHCCCCASEKYAM